MERFAERAEWFVLRALCRLGRHNASCRGRRDHIRPDGGVIS